MVILKELDHIQLIHGFSDQIKVADAHFLVSVVELTPFLTLKQAGYFATHIQAGGVPPKNFETASN